MFLKNYLISNSTNVVSRRFEPYNCNDIRTTPLFFIKLKLKNLFCLFAGCKIKALRAKTNTYIKTPVRGEEPVFVVTGRKEDVAKAKREILSAADHFSLIRAARKPTANGLGKGSLPGPPANIPGQVTIQVRVPYRVVGLVVGPKGATIKHIQQQTQTYIVTPSRDKEPVFEVTGLPDNVQTAKRQIEAHIALRTGSVASGGSPANAGLNGLLSEEASPELLASLYKNGFNSIFSYLDATAPAGNGTGLGNGNGGVQEFTNATVNSTGSSTCSSSSSSSTSSKSAMMIRPELMNIWKSFGSESLEVDEGIGESPSNIWPVQPTGNGVSRSSPSVSASPTDSLLGGNGGGIKRDCLVCGDKEVNSALVPCGHSMFCVDCANRISTTDSSCPVCSQTVIQAIRIIP